MSVSIAPDGRTASSSPETITKNGRPAAVLVSSDEYEGWKETIAILSDPVFVTEIRRGLKAMKKAKRYTLRELFGD